MDPRVQVEGMGAEGPQKVPGGKLGVLSPARQGPPRAHLQGHASRGHLKPSPLGAAWGRALWVLLALPTSRDQPQPSWDRGALGVHAGCALSCAPSSRSCWDPGKPQTLLVGAAPTSVCPGFAPSCTAVFAFPWHAALSKQRVGTDEQLAGRARAPRVPAATSPCSPGLQ